MTRFLSTFLAVTSIGASTSTTASIVPMQKGDLLWTKKVSENEIGEGKKIFYANNLFYVSDNKCNIHVLDLEGNDAGKIDGDTNANALCQAPLAFAVDSSFFIQSHTYNDTSLSKSSRVVAYNATTLDEIHNTPIPGLVEGAPVVSSDGAYTYIVSNFQNVVDNISQFQVIQNSNGSIILTESNLDGAAYAPLGVGRSPIRGNYGTGGQNTNDILVWGEKFILDRGEEDVNGVALFEGKIHFFQLPKGFDPVGDVPSLISRSGHDIGKVTLSAPLIPKHGQGAIFSFQAAQFRGWSKGHYFGKSPTLKYSVQKEFNDPIPSPNSGTFAFNDTVHIFSSPSGEPYLYAFVMVENMTHPVESKTKQLWNISTSSMVLSRVQTAFNDSLAYYVESEGDLVCIDTRTGEQNWRHQTGGHVKADVTVFDDTYLVFGTTNGYLSLIRIGDLRSDSPSYNPTVVPTRKPSNTPSRIPTALPSLGPSPNPTRAPVVDISEEPTLSPSPWPTPSGTPVPTVEDSEEPSQVPTHYLTSVTIAPSDVAVGGVTSAAPTFKTCDLIIVVAFSAWAIL